MLNGAAGFGEAVDIDGTTLVVGAPSDTEGASYVHGTAYVFTFADGDWTLADRLMVPGNQGYTIMGGDRFGEAVSISGDTLVVGAPWDDEGGSSSGAAYVFVRSNGNWIFKISWWPQILVMLIGLAVRYRYQGISLLLALNGIMNCVAQLCLCPEQWQLDAASQVDRQ